MGLWHKFDFGILLNSQERMHFGSWLQQDFLLSSNSTWIIVKCHLLFFHEDFWNYSFCHIFLRFSWILDFAEKNRVIKNCKHISYNSANWQRANQQKTAAHFDNFLFIFSHQGSPKNKVKVTFTGVPFLTIARRTPKIYRGLLTQCPREQQNNNFWFL